MIVLDTNVLSALMQSPPDQKVVDWLDLQPAESVWTTALTVFEVRFGLEKLPPGRRRKQLEEAFQLALAEDLEGRVLAFDRSAAQVAGIIAAKQRHAGRPVDMRDTQIAAIVLDRRATLATRNIHQFQDIGLNVIDPWS